MCLEDISVTVQRLKHSKEGRGGGGRGEGGREGGGGRGGRERGGDLDYEIMFWLELHGNFSLHNFLKQ